VTTRIIANAPYADVIEEIERIDKEIVGSFSHEQLRVVDEVMRNKKAWKRHPVDVRFSIPLYFARFFVVFLIGRDRRDRVRSQETERRTMVGNLSLMFFLFFLMVGAAVTLFTVFYVIKSLLGIDLIPGWHLTNWFS